ncbi:MAG: T9SS type A sorting domain-containing protein [Cyclobacteriaceae bacterium]|nr:T9SS type A sorting domain-containing protein [Cyclobacteriaceae bacterium]
MATAQVKTNFNNREQITASGKFTKSFRGKSPHVIPARDIKALLEKETRENASGEAKPFKIAEAVPTNIDVVKEAEWVEEDGFAYGKYSIVAEGAKSISANFDRFYLPQGTELYVYSENGEMTTGPITEEENNENSFWGSWVYKGEKITVDFKTPAESKSLLKLHISSIAYGYKDIYKTEVSNFGESATCNINVLCALGNGWGNERNSVALILDGDSEALCSGALINNTCNLNIPYLLTANHCFDSNVTNWKFTFQAWSVTCSPSQNSEGITFNGSTLRARNASSDFCLVELNQLPPANSGITLSGWSRNTTGITNTTIIHHPAGDVMKISRDDQAPVFANFLGAQTWHLGLDHGATQGGSSGAPYYDQNHRIIAQHFGINDGHLPVCQRVNKFGGRFDISWTGGGTNATRLSNWLDPGNTDAMTTDTRGITFITGPSLVCDSTTYTLDNQPAGTTITWLSSNPNGLSINSTTGVAARQNDFNGEVTITVTISGGCWPIDIEKNVWVGVPAFEGYYLGGQHFDYNPGGLIITSYSVCPSEQLTFFPQSYSYEFLEHEWTISGSYQQVGSLNVPNLLVTASNSVFQTFQVNYRARNTCGWGPWRAGSATTMNCEGGEEPDFVYPNPASQSFNVSVPHFESSELRLYNDKRELVYTVKPGTETVTVPVSNLPQGTYYLNIISKEGIIQRRILVQH